MSQTLRQRLFAELDALQIIDPHTHLDPLAPAAKNLAEILGYHYYTELAHSAGLPRAAIEEPGLDPREKVRRLVGALGPLENTVQYSWLIEIARTFFGFAEERLTSGNWEALYDASARQMGRPDWPAEVLRRSRLKAVFLTNAFDDRLEGFDTSLYIPCLRTDDLVFHLGRAEVRARLAAATGVEVGSQAALRRAIGALFERFTRRGARACAISLPPDFSPAPVSDGRIDAHLSAAAAGRPLAAADAGELARGAFWMLAEFCTEYALPLDLMIGVNRSVYRDGVYQGQDLFDSRVSLVQYAELFNAFPQVTFPISVLASVTNQELVSFAWIFPNVVTNGHWWYSNTPAFIERDAAARLEAVPSTKQIGYYSDMYKLEFALPKFSMYKQVLAKILAERFVVDRGWSETRALDLGRRVLAENSERIFSGRGR